MNREEAALTVFQTFLNRMPRPTSFTLGMDERVLDDLMLRAFQISDKFMDMQGKTSDELAVLLKLKYPDEPAIESTGIRSSSALSSGAFVYNTSTNTMWVNATSAAGLGYRPPQTP